MTLAVSGLGVGYGRRRVFAGVSPAPFLPGTVTAMIGPNAVGKSSLLRGVAGLLRAEGRVELSGADLARCAPAERARRIRFVPQAFHNDAALSVFEAVLVALKQNGDLPGEGALRSVATMLERLHISELADRPLPTLSGGQQQLVALAQGLVTPAPVLLLDEPTSALDLHRQLQVLSLIRDVARERGAIVIAALHDLALAGRHADRIILLRPGGIAEDGTPETVLTSPDCARIYGVRLAVERNSRGTLTVEAHL